MFFFIHAWLVIGRINGTCISRTLLFSRCKNFSIPIYTGFSHVLGFIMHRVFDILFLFHSRWFFFFRYLCTYMLTRSGREKEVNYRIFLYAPENLVYRATDIIHRHLLALFISACAGDYFYYYYSIFIG